MAEDCWGLISVPHLQSCRLTGSLASVHQRGRKPSPHQLPSCLSVTDTSHEASTLRTAPPPISAWLPQPPSGERSPAAEGKGLSCSSPLGVVALLPGAEVGKGSGYALPGPLVLQEDPALRLASS